MTAFAPFSFSTVPHLVSQAGAAGHLGEHVSAHFPQARRAMIVTDAGFLRTGLVDAPARDLEKHKLTVRIYSEVMADPPEQIVLNAVEFARQHAIDIVIGVGGGSSMDVAKLIAVLADSDQVISQIYGIGNVSGKRLPLVQVPTTAGTGSEVTNIAIVTTGETTKMGVVAPQLYADLAVLDAELTLGLPPMVTAATGIDAMVHAIEAFTSRHKKNPMSDTLAKEALRLLAGNIRKACFDGADREARAAMLLGAMLAGMAFTNAPVAAVHALAYPIGGHFHVPHGLSNSLVMPHVMRFNLPAAAAMYAELAPIVFPKIGGTTDAAKAEAMIDGIAALIAEIGLETRLGQVGISHNHVPMLAEDAMKVTRLLVNNPREVAYADAVRIYEAAL